MPNSSSLPPALSQPRSLSALQQPSQMLQGSRKNDSREKFDYPGVPLFDMPSSENDPYLFAEQMSKTHYQPLLGVEPDSFSRGFSRLMSSDAGEIELDSRQLHRSLKQSTDRMMSVMNEMKSAVAGYKKADNERGTPPHIDALNKLIQIINKNYQNVYSKINEAAAKFMQDINEALGKMSDYISAGSDGKVKFKTNEFFDSLAEVFNRYSDDTVKSNFDKGTVNFDENWVPKEDWTKPIYSFEGDDKALEFWQKKLGGGFIARRGAGNTIEIIPNLASLGDIFQRLRPLMVKDADSWPQLSPQAFQALQTAIDSDKSTINNSLSQLLERFRQDNSSFETLLQLLTKVTEDLHRYNAGYFQ